MYFEGDELNYKIDTQKTKVDGKEKLIVYALDKHTLVMIGSCIVDMHSETPLLHNLFIDENHRRKGIATDIVNLIITRCKDRKKRSICMNVKKENWAIKFYEKLGFSVVFDYPEGMEYMMAITL